MLREVELACGIAAGAGGWVGEEELSLQPISVVAPSIRMARVVNGRRVIELDLPWLPVT